MDVINGIIRTVGCMDVKLTEYDEPNDVGFTLRESSFGLPPIIRRIFRSWLSDRTQFVSRLKYCDSDRNYKLIQTERANGIPGYRNYHLSSKDCFLFYRDIIVIIWECVPCLCGDCQRSYRFLWIDDGPWHVRPRPYLQWK